MSSLFFHYVHLWKHVYHLLQLKTIFFCFFFTTSCPEITTVVLIQKKSCSTYSIYQREKKLYLQQSISRQRNYFQEILNICSLLIFAGIWSRVTDWFLSSCGLVPDYAKHSFKNSLVLLFIYFINHRKSLLWSKCQI